MDELVPADQHEAVVNSPSIIEKLRHVMEPVVGRADEDPTEGPERPAKVGVRKRDQAGVGDERGAGDGPVRPEHEGFPLAST